MEESIIERKRRAAQYGTLALAYLGDGVIELLVRERLLCEDISHPGELVKASKNYVTLEAQSDAVERILPLLSGRRKRRVQKGET